MKWSFRLLPCFAVAMTALLLACAVAWFLAPVPVEELDSLTYCACGYATVRFDHGVITMIKYPHPNVKPGEKIGTYRLVGNQVEIDTFFKGKVYHGTFVRDNVGLLNPPAARFPYRYLALKNNSPKTIIALVTLRLRETIGRWWH